MRIETGFDLENYCRDNVDCYRIDGHSGDHMNLAEVREHNRLWKDQPEYTSEWSVIPEEGSRTSDLVDQPAHYKRGKIEVREFILDQQLDFLLGNVVKYVCRHDLKWAPLQDLEKARNYLDRKIKQLKEAGK